MFGEDDVCLSDSRRESTHHVLQWMVCVTSSYGTIDDIYSLFFRFIGFYRFFPLRYVKENAYETAPSSIEHHGCHPNRDAGGDVAAYSPEYFDATIQ